MIKKDIRNSSIKQLNNSTYIKLSIIIPVYNEAATIDSIIEKIKSVGLRYNIMKEIIIINDGSTDGTDKILEQYNGESTLKIYHQEKNMGKSSAVKLGIERSTGDIILIQDADSEYSPDNYPTLIEPIITNKSSVVYGSRFKGTIKRMRFVNRIANIISNSTVNLLFNAKITDVNTSYKVFRRNVLNDITLISKNFIFETEITAKLLNKGYKIYEVPISYTARSKKEGKKITWLGALQMYWGIIKYKFLNCN
jgi:glycosyltransferase involved in cell wall biosynthesis